MILDRDAASVAQAHLDAVTAALIGRDMDRLRALFTQPAAFMWSQAVRLFEDEAALLDGLRAIVDGYEAGRVRTIDRELLHASQIAPDIVLRVHRSVQTTREQDAHARYSTFSILKQERGAWRVRVSQFSDGMPMPQTLPVTEGARGLLEDPVAKALLGDCLERVSRAYLAQDYDAYCASVTTPVLVQEGSTIKIIARERERAMRFAEVTRHFHTLGVEEIVRVPKHAVFLCENLAIGTFRAFIAASDRLAKPSFNGSAIVLRQGGSWRLCAVLNVLGAPRQRRWQRS